MDYWVGRRGGSAFVPLILLAAAPAAAAAAAQDYNLPAQDLASAIRAIGREARIDVLFLAEAMVGRRSAPVKGRMEAVRALRTALRGQRDLEAFLLPNGTLLVRARRPLSVPASRPARKPSIPAPAEEADSGSDVVVTALRRPTLLRDYPGSLTVLPGEQVAKRGRASLAEASELVPGLNLTETGPGQRRITMRGIHSAGENSVLLYLDDVPVSGPSSATSDVSQMSPDIRLYDVERIEVLRGPQGTLFGSGALGGAVRVLFARPEMDARTAEAVAGASFSEGGKPGRNLRATLNLPLIPDLLAVRATGYDERRGGVVDNVALGIADVDHARTSGGRLMARLEPAYGIDLTATLVAQRQRVADASAWFPSLGAYRTDMAERLPFPNDLSLQTLRGHLRRGPAEVTATLSHYAWNVTRSIDSTRPALNAIANGTYCPLFTGVTACDASQLGAYRAYVADTLPLVGSQPMRVHATTGEVRVALTPPGPLTLTAGLFLEHRSDASRSGTYAADAATGEIIRPERINYMRTIAVETRQAAVFGDVGFRLPADVVLTAGARRYSYNKAVDAQVVQTSYVNGAVAGPPVHRRTESEGWTGRVNLAWRPAASLLVYSQVATGFRPGGVNSVPNLPDALVAFEADSATSYEAGVRWTGARLHFSGSAYWTDWHNMQANARLPSFTFVSNSGEARIVGFDFDAELQVTDGFGIRAALNVLEAKLTSNQSNPVVAAPGLKGDSIPFEPSIKALLSGAYARSVTNGMEASASADIAYVGPSYSEYRRTSPYYERMGGYANVTLRAGVEHRRWALNLTLANALDIAGQQRVESMVNSERLTNALARRTLSLEFSWRFTSGAK